MMARRGGDGSANAAWARSAVRGKSCAALAKKLDGRQEGATKARTRRGRRRCGEIGEAAEAASVEEADAWCVAAGDVGRATGEPFVALPTE